jgi:predicted SAM-dependent methyltransferase
MLQTLRRAVGRGLLKLEQNYRVPYFRVLRVVAPPQWPQNPDGRVCVNLGSGGRTHPAFINVDARPGRQIHILGPIDKLTRFKDESVDLLYASHCLEHFSHRRTAEILQEWRRVLKVGGVLRLGVPDFDQVLAMYEHTGRRMDAMIQAVLMGGQDYPLNAHFATFTKSSLTEQLQQVGFREVRTWEPGQDELASIPDCTGLRVPVNGREFAVSLNLEAVK